MAPPAAREMVSVMTRHQIHLPKPGDLGPDPEPPAAPAGSFPDGRRG
jgi:hypothetical protein